MEVLISFCNLSEVPGFPNLGILDTDTNEFQVIELPADIPATGITGMVVSSKYILMGLQSSQGGLNAAQSPPGLLIFDKNNFKMLQWYHLNLVEDIHSMALLKDEKTLLIVSTGTDDIVEVILDDTEIKSEKVFLHLGSGERKDNHHINSIIEWQNELFVSGFGPKEAGGDWSTARNGFIMNIYTGEKIMEGLEHPHSLTVINGKLAFCESRKKSVRFVNHLQSDMLPGYTRGLCRIGNNIYAGTSKHRKKSKSTGIKNKTNDPQSLGCTINILGKENLEIESSIDLNDFAFEIYDLMPVEAHHNWPVKQAGNYRENFENSWHHRAEKVLEVVQDMVPRHESLLFVDENMLRIRNRLFPDHSVHSFLERDGVAWGPPDDEQTAYSELKRMQKEHDVRYIVFAWPAFWWFYVYPDFTAHLHKNATCLLENEDVVIFRLADEKEFAVKKEFAGSEKEAGQR